MANELHDTARAIVADHKGILAADESTGTIAKRFDSIGVESTEENRRFYRQLLFTAPDMEDFIGGVILYDETIRQSADDGTPFADVLARRASIPGIKVDTGAHDQAGFPGEKVTEGPRRAPGRLEEYRSLGARFAKWRAVITIGDGIPSVRASVRTRMRSRATPRCARRQGSSRSSSRGAHGRRQHHRALLRGHDAHAEVDVPRAVVQRVDLRDAAQAEHGHLRQGLPRAGVVGAHRRAHVSVLHDRARGDPGIVFLSGGQSEVEATENLNAINQIGGPWPLSFSYGRALQASALEAWGGRRERGRRAGGVRPPRADERAGGCRRVERRDGAAGRRLGERPRPWPSTRSARGASPRGSESARAERGAPRCAPEVEEIWRAQVDSRQADYAARWLQQHGRSFYTIGSAGHESNAAVALALRVDDPALLHYRSAPSTSRAPRRRSRRLRDIMLGVVAAVEPIAGGRHKVFGRKELASSR